MKSSESKTRSRKTSLAAKPLCDLPSKGRLLLRKLQDAVSPDLLIDQYRWDWPDDLRYGHHLDGHCYVVTEAFYHKFGKEAGYEPYCYKDDEGSHWWLRHKDTGEILDPTVQQLGRRRYHYERGHRQNFMHPSPSERARKLMARIGEDEWEFKVRRRL